jgi:hypothetical protein
MEDRTLRRRRKKNKRRSSSRRRRRRINTKRMRGTMRGRSTTRMRWWGDGSASGSASSGRYRTSHLVRPPVALHEDNRVLIVPSGDV